jgi:hypothetical protein
MMRAANHGRSMLVALVGFTAVGGLAMLFSLPGSAEEPPKVTEGKGAAARELPGGYVHVALYTFKADAPEGRA